MHPPADLQPSGPRLDSVARALLWRTSDAVLVACVRTARIVLWNPAAAVLFGYSEAEAIGLNIDLLVPEPIRPYHAAGFARFQETDTAASLQATHPSKLTILCRSGATAPVYGTLARVEGSRLGERYLMAVFRPRPAKRATLE